MILDRVGLIFKVVIPCVIITYIFKIVHFMITCQMPCTLKNLAFYANVVHKCKTALILFYLFV